MLWVFCRCVALRGVMVKNMDDGILMARTYVWEMSDTASST